MPKRSRKFEWHVSKAPRQATTDRGWYYGPGIEGESFECGGRGCFGHYLDYGPCGPQYAERHPEGTVHAVACVPGSTTGPKAVKWCRTPEEARLFIEAQAMGWEKAS